jgi:predicted  nucleic acid-binding Zn-ribbon protein
MKEIVELQKELHKVVNSVKKIEKRLTKLEESVDKDVVAMRKEAEKVLEKATALVNPYSPNTITYDKPGGSA